MKPYFLIEQPPLSEKFRLVVSELTETKNFGFTSNIDKIEYNLNILGTEFKDKFDLHNLFSEDGLTSVFQLGKFISVLERNKAKTKGKMTFFDFMNIGETSEGLKDLLKIQFSENIINEWFRIYYLMSSEFDESDDIFELIEILD